MRIFRILSVAALAASTVAFFPAGEQADAANYNGSGAYGRGRSRNVRRYRSSRYTNRNYSTARSYNYRSTRRYTPSRTTYYTPSRTTRYARSTATYTPSRTTAYYTPSRTTRSYTPSRTTAYYTPSRTTRSYTPSRTTRSYSAAYAPSRYTGPMWVERKRGSTVAPAAAVTSGAASVVPSVPVSRPATTTWTPTYSTGVVYSTGGC